MPTTEAKIESKKMQACQSKKDLESYLISKAENHSCYKFYSKIVIIDKILSSGELWLSAGGDWNDTVDRENFAQPMDGRRNFGMCFSFSRSENMAMWMLYGGVRKEGGMINFSGASFRSALDAAEVWLGHCKGEGSCKEFIRDRILSDGEYRKSLIDMVYYGEDKRDTVIYYVKRSDEIAHLYKKLVDALPFCKKNLPWQYENECRLVIAVDEDIVRQVQNPMICIKIKAINSIAATVFCAPNYVGESKHIDSALKGKVDWDLCKYCERQKATQ